MRKLILPKNILGASETLKRAAIGNSIKFQQYPPIDHVQQTIVNKVKSPIYTITCKDTKKV
jgi:hypothetical protein